jgi:hypothetical protein
VTYMSLTGIKESIRLQREALTQLLGKMMLKLAKRCAPLIQDRAALEALLQENLPHIPSCKHLYILDRNACQITDNITRDGHDPNHYGRDRLDRPYMQKIIGWTDFKLSEAYISRNKKRPSVTAIQVIRDNEGERIGFLGADYDLRDLPNLPTGNNELYHEPDTWRQLKGDPAIRGGLFLQCRAESGMDKHWSSILPLFHELMSARGVFHGKLHFSSSRATVWMLDNPFVYRILSLEELIDPNTCLAYPRHPYSERAIVPMSAILPVFELLHALRFADDNVYLRSGSLNLCNGMVSLNFSCDGSHYLRYDEFLQKSLDFWFGTLV